MRSDLLFAAVFSAGIICCSSQEPKSPQKEIMKMELTSTAFSDGQPIPQKYTGQGDDISPPLNWSHPNGGSVESFAIIVEDPDAPSGIWTHWVIYNLPADETSLGENVAKTETLPDGARQGINDFKKAGYSGPMPPPGKPHRYFFKIYALDAKLALGARASRKELLQAMDRHILDEGDLMGTYERR